MNKNLLLHFVLMVCGFTAYSQPKEADQEKMQKITVGINFGLNSSTVFAESNDTIFSDDFSRRTSGHFGCKLLYRFNPTLSLRSGFTMNNRGYRVEEEINIGTSTLNTELRFKSTYIDFPFTLQVNLAPKSNGGLFLRAGGYYGFAIGGTVTTTFSGSGAQRFQDANENLKIGNSKEDDLRREDYGLILGSGLKFKHFEIGLLWDIGMANISNNTSDGAYAKNRLFRIDVLLLAL